MKKTEHLTNIFLRSFHKIMLLKVGISALKILDFFLPKKILKFLDLTRPVYYMLHDQNQVSS